MLFKLSLNFHRIVGDNVDLEIRARVQTKDHINRSIHWTHQYAIRDRVKCGIQKQKKLTKSLKDIPMLELLPSIKVQGNIKSQFAVLVTRVIVKYFKCFQHLSKVVVYHIPHKYSHEMTLKSDLVRSLNCVTLVYSSYHIESLHVTLGFFLIYEPMKWASWDLLLFWLDMMILYFCSTEAEHWSSPCKKSKSAEKFVQGVNIINLLSVIKWYIIYVNHLWQYEQS